MPCTAHNVDEDDRAYDELIARGFRSVPVTVFGLSSRRESAFGDGKGEHRTVSGFDPAALAAAVEEWRARPPHPSQS